MSTTVPAIGLTISTGSTMRTSTSAAPDATAHRRRRGVALATQLSTCGSGPVARDLRSRQV
jgi:hypothetical protein